MYRISLYNLLILFIFLQIFSKIQSNSSTTISSIVNNETIPLLCSYCETKACRCSSTYNTLNCSSYLLNLTFASNCVENQIWNLVDFSSRNFESFDSTQLLSLRMYRLLLKSNFIIKIYDHAFDSIADSLIELDLQMNQISNISSKWFNSKFHRLQILNLALNQLETFDDFDHIHLPALRELNLSGNQIEFFPKQIHQWISLTKLDLSFNKLSSIPRFALFGLQNLKWLSLASNRNLTCIVQDSFKHLRLLNYLDLSSTNLFTVDGCIFLQLISLKILKIERVTMNCSSCWLPIARKNSIQSIGQCLDNSTIHNLSSLTDQQLDSSCSKSSIDCSTDSCEPGSFNIDSKSLSSMKQLSTLAKNSNASKNRTIEIVLAIIFSIIALLIIIFIVILVYRWKQGKKLLCCNLFPASSTMFGVVRRNRHQHQKQIINNNPTIIESVVTHGANMDVSPSYELSSNNKRKLYNPMFTDTPSNDMNSPQSSTIFLNENRFQKNQLLSENL